MLEYWGGDIKRDKRNTIYYCHRIKDEVSLKKMLPNNRNFVGRRPKNTVCVLATGRF